VIYGSPGDIMVRARAYKRIEAIKASFISPGIKNSYLKKPLN
jgi:hypothetical protein